MNNHIVVEVKDGAVSAVYCPDPTYVVDLLDRDEWKSGVDDNLDRYYQDVEKSTENLENCF